MYQLGYIYVIQVINLRTDHPRHSFSTRLLFTVLPSELYVGDTTLDALHAALVEDLLRLHHEGYTATRTDRTFCIYI